MNAKNVTVHVRAGGHLDGARGVAVPWHALLRAAVGHVHTALQAPLSYRRQMMR